MTHTPPESPTPFPLWEPYPEGPMSDAPRPFWSELGRNSAYVFAGFPLALVGFLGVTALASIGLATLVIWIGVPILTAMLLFARGVGSLERRWLGRVLDRPVPTPTYRTATGGVWARLTASWRDPQSWLDVLWTVVDMVVATFCFGVALVWWGGTLGTVAGPVTLMLLRYPGPVHEAEMLGLPVFWNLVAQVIGGLVFAVTLPPVLRGLARLRSAVSRALLCARADQQAALRAMTGSRDAVRRAEADALRRLERNIHDGPQQRLVRLNMDLARARRLAVTDPERAQQIITAAMEQAQDTLTELRQLSRGIAPPILVDRGLGAAVQEAAALSVIPVEVGVTSPRDLPDHVQTAAYFVICEALTNANKHAAASHITVTSRLDGDDLVVTITDDGRGGASLAKGHGLVGLQDRVRGVEGRLVVDSPVGGPTMVQAVMPCAS